jgi:prefoldin subunit 5
MKNVYEVLRQKEMELTRLEKEVEALRVVAPLLSEEKESISEVKPALATAVNGPQPTARIPVPASPTLPPPQPVRAAGWEETAKRWP